MNRIILLVCTVLLGGCVGFAGAYFTAQQSVPDNVISAGTVAVAAEPASEAISMENLAPGTPQSRTLKVSNTGSLPVGVTVTEAKRAGITVFYNVLTCVVTHEGETIYEGSLAGLSTAPVLLGPGESTDLDFAVCIPPGVPRTMAGDYVRVTLYVNAEQAK